MHMRRAFILLLSAAALASAADPDEVPVAGADPSCFGGKVRVSALIQTGGKVKVGIVETGTRNSYLVSPGEKAGAVEVVEADYARERVTLRMDGQTCTLNLASDPQAQAASPEGGAVYRGEAIEAFLRQHPEALQEGAVKFPMPIPPPAVGFGEGIENYLKQHPELAEKVRKPAEGRGEGIESFLREHPEIKVDTTPIPPGRFGAGIEEQMRLHPELFTNLNQGIPAHQLPGGSGKP